MSQLLKARKELPTPEERKRAIIRYRAHWPYVELKVHNSPTPILPKTKQSDIATKVLGFKSLFDIKAVLGAENNDE